MGRKFEQWPNIYRESVGGLHLPLQHPGHGLNCDCNFIISYLAFQIVYVMDTSTQAYVEECIVWHDKETLVVSKLF